MDSPIQLAGLSGSLRRGSHNTALLRLAAARLPDGAALTVCDISDFPLFNEDVEAVAIPAPVRRVREQVRTADALVIATPEYNFSVPGPLKNALDWISRPAADPVLQGKKVALMGAGGRLGTARAQRHLREICLGLKMIPIAEPEVLVVRAWEQFGPDGSLIEPATGVMVEALLAALIEAARSKA